MKKLITNAYVLDMVGDVANIEKKDILINNNIIEKIDKDINKNIEVDEKINAKNIHPKVIYISAKLNIGKFKLGNTLIKSTT